MHQLRAKLDDHLTFGSIYRAHQRASRGKGKRREVQAFNFNEFSNLMYILDTLKNGEYQPSKYWKFWIHDPKKRLILALPYVDRIVHQLYIEEFIKPYYLPRFIKDTYACIPERGIHAAADQLQKYMQQISRQTGGHYYILKMDVSKFFNSIDLNVLYQILSRVIADPKLLDLTYTILFEDGQHEGLPIGNYVSQYFANIYMNELDQFCKHNLKAKYYVRYMDDFILLAPNKVTAKRWFRAIEQYLNERLHLKLNPKVGTTHRRRVASTL